jgi:hypothetical protein
MTKKPVDAPIVTSSEPVEESVPASEGSGPPVYKYRYEVLIAKRDDPKCYVAVRVNGKPYETNTFKDAQNKATDTACDEDRECVVYDRQAEGTPLVFRFNTVKEEAKDGGIKSETETVHKRRGPKPKRS